MLESRFKRTEPDDYRLALEKLCKMGADSSNQIETGGLLHSLIESAVKLLDADQGGLIYLYDPVLGALVAAEGIGSGTGCVGRTLQPEEGLAGRVFATGQSLTIQDYQRWEGRSAIYDDLAMGAAMSIPLRWRDQRIGVMDVMASSPQHPFSPQGIQLAELLAAQAAVVISNARLRESECVARSRANALLEIMRALASPLSLHEVLQSILTRCQTILPMVTGSIMLFENWAPAAIAAVGYEEHTETVIHRIREKLKQSPILKKMMDDLRPVIVADVHQHPDWIPFAETMYIRSWMGVPLIAQGKLIGVLSLDSDQVGVFTGEHLEVAQTVAVQVAMAIENARLSEESRRAEERFLDIALSTSDWLWELDSRANITYCSEQVTAVLGYSPAELLGKAASSLLTPELARYFEKFAIELVAKNAPLSNIEVWCRHKDGHAVCVMLDAKTIAGADGAAVGYRGVARDVTAHKASEQREQLTYALGQYLSMVLSLDEVMEVVIDHLLDTLGHHYVGIYLLDVEGRNLVIRRERLRRGQQRHPDDTSMPIDAEPSLIARAARLRTPVISNRVEDDPHYRPTPWLSATRAEASFPLLRGSRLLGVLDVQSEQPEFFSKDEVRTLEMLSVQAAIAIENARLYQDLEQQATSLEELVTERTREVVRERERLKAIVENASESILFTGPGGRVEYVNPAWERTSGYRAGQLIGKKLHRLLENQQNKGSGIMAVLRRGDTWQSEIHSKRPDGSEYDAVISVTPVMDQQGQIANTVAVLRDITAQKQIEQMRKKFIANVSHELRTPITNLKLYHGLLRTGPSENRETYMSTMAEQLTRLERLVEDLLDFSRLDRGVITLQPVHFALNDLVQDILRAHAPQAEKRNIQVVSSLPAELPLIRADRHRIMQVLSNLVTNAINYTLAGGQVGISTGLEQSNSPPHLSCCVWDTGVGISPQDLPFIFDRFFRAENVKVIGVPGTGLGLSIAKEIVDLHHGRIRVESSLDKGSSFTVYLPLQQPASE